MFALKNAAVSELTQARLMQKLETHFVRGRWDDS